MECKVNLAAGQNGLYSIELVCDEKEIELLKKMDSVKINEIYEKAIKENLHGYSLDSVEFTIESPNKVLVSVNSN